MWKVRTKKRNGDGKRQNANGRRQKNKKGLIQVGYPVPRVLWRSACATPSGSKIEVAHNHTTNNNTTTPTPTTASRTPLASRAHFNASALRCRCGPAADPVSRALCKFVFIYICIFSLLNKSTQK